MVRRREAYPSASVTQTSPGHVPADWHGGRGRSFDLLAELTRPEADATAHRLRVRPCPRRSGLGNDRSETSAWAPQCGDRRHSIFRAWRQLSVRIIFCSLTGTPMRFFSMFFTELGQSAPA
jgi:hypothetical protein